MTLPAVEQFMAVEDPVLTVPNLRTDIPEQPHPYQKIDATIALAYKRFVIGEFAGSGKKLIAILAALKAFDLGTARHVAIISLGTDVKQWVEEITYFTQDVSLQAYRGDKSHRKYLREGEDPDIRVMSYKTMYNDIWHLMGMFDIVIVDEVSYIKNPESNAALAVSALCAPTHEEQLLFLQWLWNYDETNRIKREQSKKRPDISKLEPRPFPGWEPTGPVATYVWPLSATPMETGPLDLYSLCKATYGRYSPLGSSTTTFKRHYCDVQAFYIKLPDRYKKGKYYKRRIEKIKGARKEALPDLKRRLKPCYVRHPFSVVGKYLPPIEVIPVWLDMTTAQRRRYEEIAAGTLILDYVLKEAGHEISERELTAAIKLHYELRCCDGLTSLPHQTQKDSCKLVWAMNMLVNDLGDQKVIVYSHKHAPLNDLAAKHDAEGRPWVRIDGQRDDDENDRAREAFTSTHEPITLLMTDKGSYALNLQAECNYGISYNTKYNPKKQEQLYGRNRRPKPGHVGEYDESHKVVWYHALCRDSAEEDMWTILREREADFADIFGVETELFDTLTPAEQDAVTAPRAA